MNTEQVHNGIDDGVDDQIFACLDLEKPRSFFLFAGAGSGKTRSLVNVLRRVRDKYGVVLRRNRQRIAIITYTNAACDEIKSRLELDSLFFVSTIHSFAWELIKNYQSDIREWLKVSLSEEIDELKQQIGTGRAGTKTALDRENKLRSKVKRLSGLDEIRKFSYNPNGDNRTRDSLNHTEVIGITATFLTNIPLVQEILVNRYPILLIDESQDTKHELIDAFFAVQKTARQMFSLGLFGDTMQRIYSDGKKDLDKAFPEDWQTPAKRLNHRCPKRVVRLLNKIRENADGQMQFPRSDKLEGFARLYIAPSGIADKDKLERHAMNRMATVTNDSSWDDSKVVKTLILEHHMAARRLGFFDLFEPLSKVDRLRIGLLDGSLPSLRFFSELVLPVVSAKQKGDEFEVARIVRQRSPIFDALDLEDSDDQTTVVKKADDAVELLFALWKDGSEPTLLEVLNNVYASGLFAVPEDLKVIASRQETVNSQDELNDEDDSDATIQAWDEALRSPFSRVEALRLYLSDNSRFGTHQGVKGLEFPRVMVILNDDEAKGFLFNYEKILGAQPLSKTDQQNKEEGRETSIDRTLRLFYVACSRAEESLAIVAYTSNPGAVRNHVIARGWFTDDEIELISESVLK